MSTHVPFNRTNLRVYGLPAIVFLLVLCLAASGSSPEAKEKWEYKYYLPAASVCDNSNNSLVEGLNKLGADGWEVISFTPVGGESRGSIVGLDQNNGRTSIGQSVSQRAVIQSRVTGCPLLLKRRVIANQ